MWRLIPGQSLRCREWDGEVVLYNDISGSTHLLDGVALDLLHALRDGPGNAAALAGRLAECFDPDGTPFSDTIDIIGDMLAALGRLDLVEAC